MEESIKNFSNYSNEMLLSEIKTYLQPLIKLCLPGVNQCQDVGNLYGGRTQVIGEVGTVIANKIELLSERLNNPKKLREIINKFKEICDTCKKCNGRANINLLNSFKESAEDTLKLIKKTIKKQNEKIKIEEMKIEIAKLKSEISNNQNQSNSKVDTLYFFNENQTKNDTLRNPKPPPPSFSKNN